MISSLSYRYQKHIAAFLLSIFYAQMVLAVHVVRNKNSIYLWSEPSKTRSINSMKNFQPELISTVSPDSGTDGNDKGGAKKKSKKGSSHVQQLGVAPTSLMPVRDEKKAAPLLGGPTQPEMKGFTSVSANDMVDLFSGTFSYNIPLLDVGGYPVNISYHGGRTTDEDASWVGLGWNINPGSVTRDMRGLPDDFSGGADTVRKVQHIKTNTSWGLNSGANLELFGLPTYGIGFSLSPSIGIFHTTYNGWGIESGSNASLSVGQKGSGTMTAGLSMTDNSQDGFTLNPSLSYKVASKENDSKGNASLGISLSAPYNSRSGLKDIQLGLNTSLQLKHPESQASPRPVDFAGLTFAWSTYMPTMTLPMTNYNFSLTLKTGSATYGLHPSWFFSGYFGQQYIANEDTTLSLPAFGYLNYQNQNNDWVSLLDYNREKETPYRESPPVPHIAIPNYTYDVFTIGGEGTGGMFRAYRGDIGYIADHLISSKTITGRASIDLGGGEIVHGGTDLNANYSSTQNGPWQSENPLASTIAFQRNNGLFEGSYFRNPGEKTINDTNFYKNIGGDYVAVPALYQASNSSSSIMTTNTLYLTDSQKYVGTSTLNPSNAIRQQRDKRSEVISYLTAAQATVSGLDKYIYHYGINQFGLRNCVNDSIQTTVPKQHGLLGYYYKGSMDMMGTPAHIRLDSTVFFNWTDSHKDGGPFWSSMPPNPANGINNHTDKTFGYTNYSVRWLGSLQAPSTGIYTIAIHSDDGMRLWMDDSLILDRWAPQNSFYDSTKVHLIAGQSYSIRCEYFQNGGYASAYIAWRPPGSVQAIDGSNKSWIPAQYLLPPPADSCPINPMVTQEARVNGFRKPNHISEIDVLNSDGKRYVYGIPVYNLQQKDVSFAVNPGSGNLQTGLTWYNPNGPTPDNSTLNNNGQDGYYDREEMPGYAHSFLLTGILSPDYQDVTGDGISDDDIGDAVKFNYSKSSGEINPFGWRAPYITDSANYNEGFRSYTMDDKAHYIYGTKELWYLNSIESKTMIATFTLQHRSDLIGVDEQGNKYDTTKAMCLKEINLYSKADFLAHGVNATPIKTVHFVYDYELCRGINRPINDSGKLTLKEIYFTYNGNDKGIVNPYIFNYHPNNPMYNTNYTDKWGTYKNPAQNPNATPTNPINNAEYPYSLQDSAAAAYNAGAWMLDSIQLPSGGSIKVNYESQDYAYVQNRRATQMMNLVGLGKDASGAYSQHLYNFGPLGTDNLYAYIRVPYPVANTSDLRARYLDGISKLYFKLYVPMPATDDFGRGSEYIPCYADTASGGNWYGTTSHPNIIWVKLNGVNAATTGNGSLSPLAQTALNFLRLNLPSKAYPGSEIPDNISPMDGVALLISQVTNIVQLLAGFSNFARSLNWVNQIDTTRSFVRLDCPTLRKFGGGTRVHSILIYDNWNAMTGQKQTVYGQTYNYNTMALVNGDSVQISSGVASWEPAIGGEENPFHLPIEYVNKPSILAPASMGYTEEPLGESFYPGATIGYSRVRVRSINTTGTRSANGFMEHKYYTTYDFPSSWDYSMLDNNTKKRYKPLLNNFLRINSMNYLTISQGFKIELNDMNGKPRTEASYAETDSLNPISYTQYYYKVDNQNVQSKHLYNQVMTIDNYGNIDSNATIGKDAELMADMRDQTTNNIGANLNLNVDMFTIGYLPMIVPTLLNLYQHEVTRFRSAAMTKVINRYGILDSVVHMERGSIVSTKNLLYDAETGEPVLTRTQNEFNDPIYNFSYPAHWVYKGVGPAYQNINVVLNHLQVQNGQIIQGIAGLPLSDTTYFTAGDEVLAYSKQSFATDTGTFTATFFQNYLLTVVDTNAKHGGPPALFFIDQYGMPFSGMDVTLVITRSGHRNMSESVGTVTLLANPIAPKPSGGYYLQMDSTLQVVAASASQMQPIWQVEDKHRSNIETTCVATNQDSAVVSQQSCACLQPFFDYLISSRQLYLPRTGGQTVGSLIRSAAAAGVTIDTNACPLLAANYYLPFYTFTLDTAGFYYEAAIGRDIIDLRTASGFAVPWYSLTKSYCSGGDTVWFKNPALSIPAPDTVTAVFTPTYSANLFSSMNSCPYYADTVLSVDDTSSHLMTENNFMAAGAPRNASSILRFDQLLSNIPPGATILSAKMVLQADLRGHYPYVDTAANSTNPVDSLSLDLLDHAGWFSGFPYDTLLYQAYCSPWYSNLANITRFQNDTIDVTSYVTGYVSGSGLYPYASDNFILTQGSAGLHMNTGVYTGWPPQGVPGYLTTGYSNYFSTFYSQRYTDTSKWPTLSVVFTPAPAVIDTGGAYMTYNSTMSCSTVIGRTCYSSITDTVTNPFHYGILGDYRPKESMVYYNSRKETDPTQPTNIRINGTISGFMPFWTLVNGLWTPSTDTTRWVWNVQTTKYNRKGFELENLDPLGRYNSGLYGYGETMPTAVTQNSQYQEMAFDGFEDYGFVSNTCDTGCSVPAHFDFSPYAAYLSDSIAHTGLYSLRIPKGGSIIMEAAIQPTPTANGVQLTDSAVSPSGLGGIKAGASTLLPVFQPIAGQTMEFGVWVREIDSCSCQQYSLGHAVITIRQSNGDSVVYTFNPRGNVIEGWQRYDSSFYIPVNATSMVLTLLGAGNAVTYFDDIRLHPFHADMKSYVYNPFNLRLMAELDENNYATFYEYDDDGTLVRVKKETERGILTIKETRQSLIRTN